MKKLLLTFCLFTFLINAFSQQEYKIYSNIKQKVIPYLDSISKLYFEKSYHEEPLMEYQKDLYSIGAYRVFGDEIKLFEAPNDSSVVKRILHTGETLFYPNFNRYYDRYNNYRSVFYCYRLDSIGDGMGQFECFRFVFLSDGNFGFIHDSDIISEIISFPYSDLIFVKGEGKNAIMKTDLSKSCYFYPNYLVFSNDNKYLTYSTKEHDSSFVYLIETLKCESQKVGFGNSPNFAGNKIVYSSGFYQDTVAEKVHLYNIDTKKDTLFYILPDSLTLWGCGPDYCSSSQIQSKDLNQNRLYLLTLELKNTYDTIYYGYDSIYYDFEINEKGKVIEINKKHKESY
jgi:hypothetical protein